MFSSLPPAVGGLPEGTPARSADAPAFPRVHEMPPGRSDGVMSSAERKKAEAELAAARDAAARAAPPRPTLPRLSKPNFTKTDPPRAEALYYPRRYLIQVA